MKKSKTFYMIPCDKMKEVFNDIINNDLSISCLNTKENVIDFCEYERKDLQNKQCKKCKKKPVKYKINIEIKKN